MNRFKFALVVFAVFGASIHARAAGLPIAGLPGLPESRVENPLFGYTHLLPGPHTLPAGRLIVGTDLAYGVTDFLQIGTNIVSNFYQVYNANAKVSLVDYPEFALGLNVGYQSYNYHDVSAKNPNLRISSWLPGAVAAIELLPDFALFVGGNLNYSDAAFISEGVETSGYYRGASVGSDISWEYNPRKNKVGNVLAGGVTYDLDYKVFGFGFSHHWPGLHLGIHYYPNASKYRVQPIISGGATIDM